MNRRLAALVVGLALAAVSCGGGRDALTIYSGRSQNLVGPLLEQFNEETGIPVDVRYGDSVDLALLIAEEGDRTPADVFFSQSPGTVGFLGEQDLLGELPAELVEPIDPRYASDEGTWVGVTARQRVLVYNQDLVDEADLPASVLDLVGDEYGGRVAVAPSNASFQDFVTAMRQRLGDDETLAWLEGMAGNDSPVYSNNNAIVEAVGRGEVPMGLVNHYYNERFLEEDPGLPSRNHVFGDGDIGSLVIESSATILSTTARRNDAERFVEFLLSEEAQRYFADETKEYPLRTGMEPADGLEPLGADAAEADVDDLGDGFTATRELIDRSGIAD